MARANLAAMASTAHAASLRQSAPSRVPMQVQVVPQDIDERRVGRCGDACAWSRSRSFVAGHSGPAIKLCLGPRSVSK